MKTYFTQYLPNDALIIGLANIFKLNQNLHFQLPQKYPNIHAAFWVKQCNLQIQIKEISSQIQTNSSKKLMSIAFNNK